MGFSCALFQTLHVAFTARKERRRERKLQIETKNSPSLPIAGGLELKAHVKCNVKSSTKNTYRVRIFSLNVLASFKVLFRDSPKHLNSLVPSGELNVVCCFPLI